MKTNKQKIFPRSVSTYYTVVPINIQQTTQSGTCGQSDSATQQSFFIQPNRDFLSTLVQVGIANQFRKVSPNMALLTRTRENFFALRNLPVTGS